LQFDPVKPASQAQLPSKSAVPLPLQVTAFVYWQNCPVVPGGHMQAPVPLIPELHVPLLQFGHGKQLTP
jgi:hypothetical protein